MPRKNYLLPAFLFFQILPCFALLQFCKSCACFFLAKTFWKSWEKVALVENLYFQQFMMSFIWREFSSVRRAMMKEDSEVPKAQAWGCPRHPQEIFKETQASKLGDAPMHPLLHQQLLVHPSPHYIFIASSVMCFAWSVLLFSFQFFFV